MEGDQEKNYRFCPSKHKLLAGSDPVVDWKTTYGKSNSRYMKSRVGFVGPMKPSARPRMGKLFLRSGRAEYSGSSGSPSPFRLEGVSPSISFSLMWSSKPLPARLT